MIISDPLSSSLEELVVVVLISLVVVVDVGMLFVFIVVVVLELLPDLKLESSFVFSSSSPIESTVIVDPSSIIFSFVLLVCLTKLGFVVVLVLDCFVLLEVVSESKYFNPEMTRK